MKNTTGELQSLERGLGVLDLLCRHPDNTITIGSILEHSQMPRTTAYRILRVLKANGFLADGPQRGNFVAGPKLIALSGKAEDQSALSAASTRVLKDVVDQTLETAFITVRSGSYALCLEREESPNPVRLTYERGRMMPLHAGCSAKLILAYSDETTIRRTLAQPLERYSDKTVTDPTVLSAQLEVVRQNGYCVSRGETDPGAAAVCLPIFSRSKRFLGGLTVAGPDFRVTDERLETFIRIGREAADELGNEIA